MLRQPDLRLVILRAGCSYRQRLEEVLARRGVVGLRRLEFGTLEAILGAVAAGLGITLMPRALIGPTWRGGQHPRASLARRGSAGADCLRPPPRHASAPAPCWPSRNT